jgi:hypothetical protein
MESLTKVNCSANKVETTAIENKVTFTVTFNLRRSDRLGKYAVIEVSAQGFEKPLELDETDDQTAKYQHKIKQSFIEPEHVMGGHIYNTNDLKHYFDFWAQNTSSLRMAS